MLKKLLAFWADTSGVTGVEYGFILGGVALTLMTGAFMYGDQFSGMMEIFSLKILS